MADERKEEERDRWGIRVPWMDARREDEELEELEEAERSEQAGRIPKTRVGRSAKLGAAIGTEATRYAGTAATNIGRSEERKAERMESRHLDTALKMASVLGEMKGAAMKIGQMASFIDIDFLPPEYREIYQRQLAKLRAKAPAMPWKKVRSVLDEEYREESFDDTFAEFEHAAFAAASIGQVHRARLLDGTEVAVKIQYPGIARAIRADLANARLLLLPLRLGRDWDNLMDQLKEISRGLELEADYLREARWTARARAHLADVD
ncbi:MAG: AarF/UbiB family protein, partial [Solirubrobacterales bacterium]